MPYYSYLVDARRSSAVKKVVCQTSALHRQLELSRRFGGSHRLSLPLKRGGAH